MGYLHINNLYKDQRVLQFKEVYAMEKIHGTSAHIAWRDGQIHFFSGGEKHANFVALFNEEALRADFEALGVPKVTIFGEAYGGACQRNSWRYGSVLKFVAFDVQANDEWLLVPRAEEFATDMGLEFVDFRRVDTSLVTLDSLRDAPSTQAQRNGIVGDQPREGIVIHPVYPGALVEPVEADGHRIIAKHKRADERETKTQREVVEAKKAALEAKLRALEGAESLADEWVTQTRLEHILDKLGNPLELSAMQKVLATMMEDVFREGVGEVADTQANRGAICKATVGLFKTHCLLASVEGK